MTKKEYYFYLKDDEITELEDRLKSFEGFTSEKLRNCILHWIRPQDKKDLTHTKHCPFYCLSVKDAAQVVCAVDWTKRHRIVRVPKDFCLNTCQLLIKEEEELEKTMAIPEQTVYNVQPLLVKNIKGETEQTVDSSKTQFCKLRARLFYDFRQLPCIRREVTCPEVECVEKIAKKFL